MRRRTTLLRLVLPALSALLILLGPVPAHAQLEVAEALLVDLRADDLPYGPVVAPWLNHGTLGVFDPHGSPVVADMDGRKAVLFDGQSYFQGPASIPTLEGSSSRSIEVWVRNDAATVDEETLVSWSHRGGPAGTNLAFNYGQHPTWGAVGHWDAPDMGWSAPHSPLPAPEHWWYLVYTYDGTTVRLYVNGEANTTRTVTLNTHAGAPLRVAAQADNTGNGVQADLSFTGAIAAVRIHAGALTAEQVAHNLGVSPPPVSVGPSPANGEQDVDRRTTLRWQAGRKAAAHHVYLGTSLAEIEQADTDSPLLVSRAQTATAYTPPQPLVLGQTYYWRVDDVNTQDPAAPFQGDVWRFTVEPTAYPLAARHVTASSSSQAGPANGPEKTVDGSGLNTAGEHGTDLATMWLSSPADAGPARITFAFDRLYAFEKVLLWNHNSPTEAILGFGIQDAALAASRDGDAWTELGSVTLEQAPGDVTYAGQEVSLDRVEARYLRLTVMSNYSRLGLAQAGLSEARFYTVPTRAGHLLPADGSQGLTPRVTLQWRAGREAAYHEVYLGTDPNALTRVGTPTAPTWEASADLGGTFYWRVDEVNDAESPATWTGTVQQFTVRSSITIDDMEAYRDLDGYWIWQTWEDGFNDPANGGVVGHGDMPETFVSFDGSQALPLAYSGVSWTRRTLTWTDWTVGNPAFLRLHFSGTDDSSGTGLYVEVNGKRVTYPDDTRLHRAQWTQWDIPLSDLPSRTEVTSLTLGIQGGSGRLIVDAMSLQPADAAAATPQDPGPESLAAYYPMEGNLVDASGHNRDGTHPQGTLFLPGDPAWGQAMVFDGAFDRAELPIGEVIAAADRLTVSLWANFNNEGGAWQRLFDFGSGNTNYVFLCPRVAVDGPMRLAIRTPTLDGGAEQIVNGPATLPPGWHHVAAVIDGTAHRLRLYLDGLLWAEGPTQVQCSDLGVTTQNYLGDSQWPADALFQGALDEVRIYTEALEPSAIRFLAGLR